VMLLAITKATMAASARTPAMANAKVAVVWTSAEVFTPHSPRAQLIMSCTWALPTWARSTTPTMSAFAASTPHSTASPFSVLTLAGVVRACATVGDDPGTAAAPALSRVALGTTLPVRAVSSQLRCRVAPVGSTYQPGGTTGGSVTRRCSHPIDSAVQGLEVRHVPQDRAFQRITEEVAMYLRWPRLRHLPAFRRRGRRLTRPTLVRPCRGVQRPWRRSGSLSKAGRSNPDVTGRRGLLWRPQRTGRKDVPWLRQ